MYSARAGRTAPSDADVVALGQDSQPAAEENQPGAALGHVPVGNGCVCHGYFTRTDAAAEAGVQRRCGLAVCGIRFLQEGQAGAYGVGAGARRLAAAGPELRNPLGARALVFLFGRGVQGPLGVVQVGAAQCDEVGAAGKEDGVDVVVGGDGADGDHGHACRSGHFLADAVGERRLVAAAEGRLFLLGHLAGGDVQAGGAVGDEGAGNLDGIVGGVAALDPVRGGDAHRHRLAGRPRRADGVEHFQREPQPVLQAAAVFVGPPVGNRREERGQQVAVGGVDLEEVETCLLGPQRRGDELLLDGVHAGPVQLGGSLVVGAVGQADGPTACQLPDSSGSSMPSHMSLVEPLRPEWPIWAPIFAVEWLWTKSTISFQLSRWPSVYRPVQPGVMRPASETQTISVITRPAPPRALEPRWTLWKSPGMPSTAEYMSMGETTIRFFSSSPPMRKGWNMAGAVCVRPWDCRRNCGPRSRRIPGRAGAGFPG